MEAVHPVPEHAASVTADRDFAVAPTVPGALRARVSAAARAVAWLVGGGVVGGGGVIGGLGYCLLVRDADLLFWPMISVYIAFGFWLYAPRGYRFGEETLEVLRPRGALVFEAARIVGVAGGEGARAFCAALAERTGARWLARIAAAERVPDGARLLWIDPELPGFSGGTTQAAAPWAIPLWGHFSIWGGCVGRFWEPGAGVELRQSRSYRPRLGLWVLEAPQSPGAVSP